MYLTINLLKATEKNCGILKYAKQLKQAWWWDNSVNGVINKYDTQNAFRITKQMKKKNKDIMREKLIPGNSRKLAYCDGENKKTWKQRYERLLNVEFPRWEEDL